MLASGVPYSIAYGMSKGGILQLSRSLAVESLRRPLRSTPSPRQVPTRTLPPRRKFPSDVDVDLVTRMAGPRHRRTRGVAALFAFLASDEARSITGSNLHPRQRTHGELRIWLRRAAADALTDHLRPPILPAHQSILGRTQGPWGIAHFLGGRECCGRVEFAAACGGSSKGSTSVATSPSGGVSSSNAPSSSTPSTGPNKASAPGVTATRSPSGLSLR